MTIHPLDYIRCFLVAQQETIWNIIVVVFIVVVVIVVVDPRNLPLKFSQNRDSNNGNIADIEFVWKVVCRVIFMSNPTYDMLS